MTCEEFQARVAELALESLEPGSRPELEAHLAEAGPHSGCAEAAKRARAAALVPGLALDPVPVSPAVWRNIDALISPKEEARPSGFRSVAMMAIAAAGLIAVGAVALWQRAGAATDEALAESSRLRDQLRVSQAKQIEVEQGRLTADHACAHNIEALKQNLSLDDRAVALLEQPGTTVVSFAPQPTHPELKAAAIYNPKTHQAMVISTGLPAVTAHDYQLWIIRGKGAPIPAGLLTAESGGTFHVELAEAALGAIAPDALAISIEPKGGSATPTDVALVAALHS